MIYLWLAAYALIGFVLGRIWFAAWELRGEPNIAMGGIFLALVWPLSLVMVPATIALVAFVEHAVVPVFSKAGSLIDRLVARVVPEKLPEADNSAKDA